MEMDTAQKELFEEMRTIAERLGHCKTRKQFDETYEKNEDNNDHTANNWGLAIYVNDHESIVIMENIARIHATLNYLPMDVAELRYSVYIKCKGKLGNK